MAENKELPAIEPALDALVQVFRFPPTPALAEEVCAELEMPTRGPTAADTPARSTVRLRASGERPRDRDRRRVVLPLALAVTLLAVILVVLVQNLQHVQRLLP